MRLARDPAALAAPAVRLEPQRTPRSPATAILVCMRNEDAARLQRNLAEMIAGLDWGRRRAAPAFLPAERHREPGIAAAGGGAVAQLRRVRRILPGSDHHRRRPTNRLQGRQHARLLRTRWGADYEFMLVLDADSLMSGETILRLIRMMRPIRGWASAEPGGRPAAASAVRPHLPVRHAPGHAVLHHGQRLVAGRLRAVTGATTPSCASRLSSTHCGLPILPGSRRSAGHVLCHDQVEAALMRTAGYEVRVLPDEPAAGKRTHPPCSTSSRRDLRWCQGNMQYWKLLDLPGLLPMSRFQLAWRS